ncbi:MAG: ABC transporter ATP-binding protein [Candidatus Thermoplasmatota archaeon]|jgi:ABC-2 type transport system ATP-binding protein|nr:ABC transporter ATP-binding protein [Candidatus Thermoplasmatota archaeon]
MDKENIIIVSNLTKRYKDISVVNCINFDVKRGEIFGFLGPNGAGKTTTIKMLTGLIQPTKGTATITGKDIRTQIIEIKKIVGVVTEDSNLYDDISVLDNLRFVGQLYGVPKVEREKRIGELLKRFDLEPKQDAKFATLSKGMKRKVTIAAAFIHSPQVIFLDEPTTGLDVLSARILRAMIKELKALGVTIFLTTHYIEEAEQLCDRVVILVKGIVKIVDTPRNLMAMTNSKKLEEAFIEITGLKEEIMLVEKEGK